MPWQCCTKKQNPGSPNGPPMVKVWLVRIFSGGSVTFIVCAEILHVKKRTSTFGMKVKLENICKIFQTSDWQRFKDRCTTYRNSETVKPTTLWPTNISDKQRVLTLGHQGWMPCTVNVALLWNIIYWICISKPLFVTSLWPNLTILCNTRSTYIDD